MDFSSNKQSRKQEPKGSFYAWNVVVVKITIKPKMWKLIFKIPPPPKLAWRSAMWWRHYQAAILKEVCYISEMAIRTTTKEYFLSLYRVITILDLLIVGETRPFENQLERQRIKTICYLWSSQVRKKGIEFWFRFLVYKKTKCTNDG